MSVYDVLTDIQDNNPDKSVCYGITVGVVTNIDDPDKQGKVKVRLLNRDTSKDETGFIRVATPMSGKKWGMFFSPEVGDEVLVAFSNGDISRPYVLGSLWNKDYVPPTEIKDSKNDIRMIKTRSGHQIIFDDTDGKEKININTPKGFKIIMDDEKEAITISDSGGGNIVKIDAKNGKITIKADKKIEISSGNSKLELDGQGNKATLESAQSLRIKSQQVVIEADNTLDLKSSNMLNVNANGPANLKGAVVKLN